MRRAQSAMMLGLLALGCGPSLPSSDDQAGDEANDEDSTSSGGSESDTTSTSTDETDTSDTSSESTGADECPSVLTGTLEITDDSNLDEYTCLREAEWIVLDGSFPDLGFLSQLERTDGLHIRSGPLLLSLAGLDSLVDVHYLWIYDAPNLVDLAGLRDDVNIEILSVGGDMSSLTSIAMPPGGAQTIGFGGWQRADLELLATANPTPLEIHVRGAPLLEDLDDIAQCCLAQQAELSIDLTDTPLLTDLQGLEPFTALAHFRLGRNDAVTSLAGLQNLAVVGELWFGEDCGNYSSGLVDLTGLEQLIEIDDLRIQNQSALVSLAGLPTEVSVTDATFYENPMLDQTLINAWLDAVGLPFHGCGNLHGPWCEGICPQ